ncbi:MAG: T9SS type A sorting domain-containing protein [Bacteroidales bacterium]|nr:T9SS type A sorting domain-containing protein [Bacteroidales bacterium]
MLLVISQLTTGQTIVRSSLSCLGSTITDNGLFLRQTMGQPSGTDVLKIGGMELRQGFQQPVAANSYIRDAWQFDFTLSPNPAKNFTLLSFKEEISGCSIFIRDINGSTFCKYSTDILYEKWLDLSGIRPGIYIVTVICQNGYGSKKLIITN